MPSLHVLRGADKGQVFGQIVEAVILGRFSDKIPLTDDSVSRRHAELRPENGRWVLSDLGSSNGTYLNGVRIEEATALKHGDQIKLGGTLLVFFSEESTAPFSGAAASGTVQWRAEPGQMDSSILSAVPSSEDSLILAAPETAEAVHAWKVMYQLAEVIGSGLSVQGFLERITDIIFEHLVVDHVVVLMRQGPQDELTPRVVRSRIKSKGRSEITTSQSIIDHVVRTKEGVLCANAQTDLRFADEDEGDSLKKLGLRSVLCVPILAHDEVDGVIHLDCSMSRHTYTGQQLRLATAIGRMTGMAIENAQLLESRVANERLAAVGETVAHLSHYIRNVLQGMRSGADVLEMGLRRQALEVIESGWKIIQHNLDRTYQLTTNMLTFSKKRQPAVSMGQLNHAVEDALAMVRRRAEEKGVTLVTELAPDLPPVPLDLEGMTQVAANILSNAIDAVVEQTGRVSVRTRYDGVGDRVTLTVADNGPGIPPELIGRVFEAFHSTKGHGGTGLGLAAARKVVNELGGQIELISPTGQGTTFHVHLPVTTVRLADAAETLTPPE